MKVYFEVKEDWVDAESPDGFISMTMRSHALIALKEAFVEQVLKKQKIPKITISHKELKKAVLERMAERVIEEQTRT